MTIVPGDFELTMLQVRAVTRFAVSNAESVLAVFTAARPGDARPAAAIEAARLFVDGGRRTMTLRTAATEAHRAARSGDEAVRLAARSAGDAAGAAYLHPIAKAQQVGHILRSAACAVRIAELTDDRRGPDDEVDPDVVETALRVAVGRADGKVVEVLRYYPPTPPGRSRLETIVNRLDVLLRTAD